MDSLNRREFVRGVGAAGISGNVLTLDRNIAQIGDVSFDPNEEVAYVAGWSNNLKENGEVEKEPMYKTMSQEKWDRLQATEDAAQQLGDVLENSELQEDWIGFLESIDENSDTGQRLDVALTKEAPYTEEEVMEYFPSKVAGQADIKDEALEIPVDIETIDFEKTSYSEPYEQFDDVPGAAPVISPSTPDASGCTAGPFYHNNYGVGWITARHVVDDSNGAYGNKVELAEGLYSGSGEVIGEVRDSEFSTNKIVDIAYALRTINGKTPHEWIAGEDYNVNEDIPITTVFADTELEAQKGNQRWNISLQGQTSGRKTSYIDNIYRDNNGDIAGIGLADSIGQDGDSGGPHFQERNGDAYIAGVHHASTSSGEPVATTAETTENILNGNWMTQ